MNINDIFKEYEKRQQKLRDVINFPLDFEIEESMKVAMDFYDFLSWEIEIKKKGIKERL